MEGRVLIIDDEPLVREIVQEHLRQAGFETATAEGGCEGQARLEEGSFDVAVVDLAMPDVSGLDVLAWMREHVPDVVPIVLSGTARIEDAVQAVQRGAFDFVAKPIESPAVLVQHIERAVAHRLLSIRNALLLKERQEKAVELENRLSQLELAHSLLQSQAMALQVDLERAAHIQHALLPKSLPFSDRISLSVLYRPAAKVGGDLYDVFPVDERRLGLYVADTAGHGGSSALLALFLKLAVSPVEEDDQRRGLGDPSEVLGSLNRLLLEEGFGHEMFVSMTYVVLDVQTFEAHFASAGHPALLVRRRDGCVDLLRMPAPALGLSAKGRYFEQVFTLQKGDVVVLYTDGVLDVCNATGDFFGRRRLRDTIARAGDRSDLVVQAVEDDLDAFRAPGLTGDDITVAALGARPQPEAYQAPQAPREVVAADLEGVSSTDVRSACEGSRVFIAVAGPGSWQESQRVFKCPCHGSGFHPNGINFEGPAPRPLERYAIRIAEDGQLEVDTSVMFQEELGQWNNPASYVTA